MLPHTRTPNATVSFVPKVAPEVGSRRKLPDQHVLTPATAAPTATRFDGDALLRPVSFKDAQAYGIQSEGADVSSGQVYAGFWRLDGRPLPSWIGDGRECAIAFTEGKRLSGTYYTVPARTEWAKSRGLGPDFMLKTTRQN